VSKPKKGQGVGGTIGSVLAGFDQQIFRTTPPPHELVQKGKRLPAVPAEGGGTISIDLPEDEPRQADRSSRDA
jgi:hypothetical protein